MQVSTIVNAGLFPLLGISQPELIQNVPIDGEPWHSNCYLEWDVFEKGSTVDLELTDDRTVACGVDDSALPPSLSTGGYS